MHQPHYATSARFTLLAYNLTCLYAFNLREVNAPIDSIAFRRFMVTALALPYIGRTPNMVSVPGRIGRCSVGPPCERLHLAVRSEAGAAPSTVRVRFRSLLLRRSLDGSHADQRHFDGRFFLDTAYYYQQIIRAYSTHKAVNSTEPPQPSQEETPLLASRPLGDVSAVYAMEEVLQRKLLLVSLTPPKLHLQLGIVCSPDTRPLPRQVTVLLGATRHEPRLKGPFPIAAYRLIVSSCRSILSSLTAIARMVESERWLVQVRRDFVAPVSRERREMVGNVTLFLSLLSSSTILKHPLPAYLPPAEQARGRLLAALRSLDVVKERTLKHGASSLIYYAYVVMMAVSARSPVRRCGVLSGCCSRVFRT